MSPAEPGRGEFALIRRYFSGLDHGPAVALGVGDDAALLSVPAGEVLVTSTDTQVEGRHFPATADGDRIAYRAVAAAASDLAAMGASPLAMTLALTLPRAEARWLGQLSSGLREASDAFSLPLVGGDTTMGPLTLTLTVFGSVPAQLALRRSGAAAGDRVCVSGALGDAAAGLAVVLEELSTGQADAQALAEAFWRPQPRLALGQALRGHASAAIDISDGLLADAGHLARASGVRLVLDAQRIPRSPALLRSGDAEQVLRWTLGGGDDYQLCFTLPPAAALPEGCSEIGWVEAGEGVYCPGAPQMNAGYQHFQ